MTTEASDPITSAKLRQLAQMTAIYYRHNARLRVTLEAWLEEQARQLEKQAERRLVLRPAGDEWELGHEGATRRYSDAPAALVLAHQAIAGEPVRAPGGANAGRNRLRRAACWVEQRATCPQLGEAMRQLRVARDGRVTYQGPAIVTAQACAERVHTRRGAAEPVA